VTAERTGPSDTVRDLGQLYKVLEGLTGRAVVRWDGQMFGCLDGWLALAWMFGVHLDVWMFGCLDVWMFGCLDVWIVY
jgi:hypothetical protein